MILLSSPLKDICSRYYVIACIIFYFPAWKFLLTMMGLFVTRYDS